MEPAKLVTSIAKKNAPTIIFYVGAFWYFNAIILPFLEFCADVEVLDVDVLDDAGLIYWLGRETGEGAVLDVDVVDLSLL